MGALSWPWNNSGDPRPVVELLRSRDLTRRLPNKDATSLALDGFIQDLHQKVGISLSAAVRISGEAPRLSSLAKSAQAQGRELSRAADTFASTSEEITATLESELAPSAAEVAQLSNRVADSLRQCEAGSSQVLGHIDTIRQSETGLSSAIAKLQAQLEEVTQVIGVIAGISKQTNLLSLNAAIEAARAGEHGRGFSVVAEEVRRLAQHTTDATDQVADIVSRFNEDMAQLTQAGDTMQSAVGAGAEGVETMRSELSGVRTAMDQLDDRVGAMASGTGQISQAIGDLNKDVHTVSQTAGDLLDSAQRIGDLGDSVHHQSDRLLEGLGGFQLDIHQAARRSLEPLSRNSALLSDDLSVIHGCLRKVLNESDNFELMYLVSAEGFQVSENVFASALSHLDGSQAKGTDWRTRHWFRAVMDSRAPHITEVYRSSATDDFCFTLAMPIWCDDRLFRVLGADVRLSAITD